MTQHTPGPWNVSVEDNNSFICDQDGYTVAEIYARSARLANHVNANARLIASAPELLAALECLDNYVCNSLSSDYPTGIDIESDAFLKARAAIAKATGES